MEVKEFHLQRFDSQTFYAGDCIVWIGTTTRGGYGQFRYDNKRVLAHRFSYERHIGKIPIGLQIDHLCRTRACVNPAHMEPVTCRENILRGSSIQAMNARKTHCSQGHPFDAANTGFVSGRRVCLSCNRTRALAWFHKNKKKGVRSCKK